MSANPEPAPVESPHADLPGRHRIGHLVWEASARVMLFAEPIVGDTELSLASIGVLEGIATFPGVTASEIARNAFKTQQAASQITGRLERLGYIERRVGPGRGVGLYITPAGAEALATGIAREEEVDQRLVAMLGAERAEQLRELLGELRDEIIAADPRQ